MGWRGVLKGVFVTALLVGSVLGLWYGVVLVVTGGVWRFVFGVALFIAAFRGVILAYDLMWGRPPVFSKRPWERPWEHEQTPHR
jgi:MFS family permease